MGAAAFIYKNGWPKFEKAEEVKFSADEKTRQMINDFKELNLDGEPGLID